MFESTAVGRRVPLKSVCQAPNSSSTHRQAGRLPSAGCVSPRHSVEPAEAPPILAPISPNPVTNANAAIASTWLSEFYLSRPRFPQPERVSRRLAPRAPVMRPARSLSRDKTVGPRILTNQLAPQRLSRSVPPVVRPDQSRSTERTHSHSTRPCSQSAFDPPGIATHQDLRDAYCSNTSRNASSRTSSGYLALLSMAPLSGILPSKTAGSGPTPDRAPRQRGLSLSDRAPPCGGPGLLYSLAPWTSHKYSPPRIAEPWLG